MDIFTERTIELMKKREFDRYLKLMIETEMPIHNKITLIYMNMKKFEQEVNQEILDEAVKRREVNGS